MVRLSASALALILAGVTPVAWGQNISGEPSRTPATTALTWRAPDFPETLSARIGYRPLPVERLLQVQKRNAERQLKPLQIGVGRVLASEGGGATPAPPLQWRKVGTGAVARMAITSPDALGIRVGLKLAQLHPDVELRFAGSDAPDDVVASVRAGQAQLLADAQGLYWTPATDGQTQWIEIHRPAHVAVGMARISAPQLAHQFVNSQNDFKLLEKVGESGSCNIDSVCMAPTLGDDYARAVRSVAHMQYVTTVNGQTGTYICTGTLLNDMQPTTQVPYFYSAHHCISTQTEASTLNTFWSYEATSCGSGVSRPVTRLSGGATYLHSDATTDALLLRLNDPAPAGAEFSGWDSSALPSSSAVLAIHHPRGDLKKSSTGRQIPVGTSASRNAVAWLSGTTEGGSSGSGLFTRDLNGYRLRGGLYGGSASCSNTGSEANAANRDYYSRFDAVFPQLQQWLATGPGNRVASRSSQPLIPGQPNVSSAAASAVPAVAAPASTIRTRSAIRQRGALKRAMDR